MKQKKLIPDKPIKIPFRRKKKRPKPKGLTKKQTRFCHEYVIDHNGSQAAIRAGYSSAGASSMGSQLLANLKVKELVQELETKLQGKLEISAERVLLEIARLATFDPRKLYDADGNLIPIHKLDDDTAACVAGIEIITHKDPLTKAITKKYKIWDKNSALDKMKQRYSKLFEAGDEEDKPVSKRMFFQVVDASKSDQDDKEDE